MRDEFKEIFPHPFSLPVNEKRNKQRFVALYYLLIVFPEVLAVFLHLLIVFLYLSIVFL
jgi:hypothetical protein